MPRMRNTYMENGPHTKDEIIASVERGTLAETFTNGQVAIGAGDFTFYIKNGWMIEDGKLSYPIKDCNIIGNGPDVLRRVSAVGCDLGFEKAQGVCGKEGQSVPVGVGQATLRIDAMTIGGSSVS